PDAEAIGAVTEADLKTRPDAVIVVGTSLKIPGVRRIVREMCGVTQGFRGGVTIWINEDDPPLGPQFDGIFDLIVRGNCERVARLANLPRHDGSTPDTEDEFEPQLATPSESECIDRASTPAPSQANFAVVIE